MPILEVKAEPSAIRRILRAIGNVLLRRGRRSAGERRLNSRGTAKTEPLLATMRRQRLAEAAARLENLEAQRELHGDSHLGMTTENRIVWNELIELELQEIDEQVNRICSAADGDAKAPAKSNLREGGLHGRDHS